LIINSLGYILAGPDYAGEKILTTGFDPGELAEEKFE
jgi:hypothetical protein